MPQRRIEKSTAGSGRINALLVFVFVIGSLVFGRLFYIAHIQHDALSATAENQKERTAALSTRRGTIRAEGQSADIRITVATRESFPYIYVIPQAVTDPQETVQNLKAIFPPASTEALRALVTKPNDPFELVAKRVSKDIVDQVENLSRAEIQVGYEDDRYYPQGGSLAHVLGFFGFQDAARAGQYGLEGFYDDLLRKEVDLTLTIDPVIQSAVETELVNLVNQWSADSGTIIVQDPNSGAILAMASSPSFDPNNYGASPLQNFVNPATQRPFEPGSTMKTITMAAGIDANVVSPNTTYEDKGVVSIASYEIKNFDEKAHGVNTMTQVLEKSLNTGAIFVQRLLGQKNFINYFQKFGFGKKTEIDLAGESSGNISNLETGREINFATASFGQGVTVTPIQLIGAYSAVANGGKLLRPYVVKSRSDRPGETQPLIVGVPISEKTSAQLKEMLTNAVDHGSIRTKVTGYDVAAKTGTAQVADPEGGYADTFIHDMVGFAPSFGPRFTILIKLDNPKGVRFASSSLASAFQNLTKFLLNYFDIPPTR